MWRADVAGAARWRLRSVHRPRDPPTGSGGGTRTRGERGGEPGCGEMSLVVSHLAKYIGRLYRVVRKIRGS